MTGRQAREQWIGAVAGLGNPGRLYEKTRHNAGYQVLDLLAADCSVFMQERKFKAEWGFGSVEGRKVLFMKPLAFMNKSGGPVGEILAYFGIPESQLLVIHDDLDLSLGRLRLVRRGGAGGHRGVLSLIEHLRGQNFPRLKLGIGRPAHGEPVEEYVLQAPSGEEAKVFQEMIAQGAKVAKAVLVHGLDHAMNAFN